MTEPSKGRCYGCRHPELDAGHCFGTGNLEPGFTWPGFVCTCPCTTPPRCSEER